MAQGEGRDPGSVLHPAVMLSLPAPTTGEQLVAAYRRAYDELGGIYAWMPLAETDMGWRVFVLAEDVDSTERVACGLDLRTAVLLEYDVGIALARLQRGCAILQEELGGTLGPLLDDTILERGERLRALVEQHGEIRLLFTQPDGFLFRDVHRAVRSLGLIRSDFGSYAWYNEQDWGHDRLIVVEPGIHPAVQEGADDRTPDVLVSFRLAQVPLPEHVAERVWQVAATLEQALGAPPRVVPPGVYGDGPGVVPIDRTSYRERVETALAALRREGWFRDVVVAEP